MADPLDSQNIARHPFGVGRRGYEQQEVRAFLHEVSALVERLQREGNELRQRAERAEARLGVSTDTDDAMLLEILGEETTRVLTSAREAAAEIRAKADAAAERIIGDAAVGVRRGEGRGDPGSRSPARRGRGGERRAAQQRARRAGATHRRGRGGGGPDQRRGGRSGPGRPRRGPARPRAHPRGSRGRAGGGAVARTATWWRRRRPCASGSCATWRSGARRHASRSRSSTPGGNGCCRPTTSCGARSTRPPTS